MEQVTLTIDGAAVTVPKGTSVLQAAIAAGIEVPYYCYHPGLGIDASCRVCLVKIEKMPKLQTSCSTPAAEGMVVLTKDAESTEARAGVFEFLLINHPLDCPVCDKGGECPLQDFSYSFGNVQSRMDFPRRTFDGEGVKADVDFGPTLMLNRNRCIMCTRCARFMREVDGDAQIGIVDRGHGSEIATFNEQGVHSILSGNLMDVCPVGAITTRQYRFRSRPWDNPNAIDTICTGCAKGCATTAWLKAKPEWAKGSQLVRVTPRYNPEVNGFWMCDIGRFQYRLGRRRRPAAQAADPRPRRPRARGDVEGRARRRARPAERRRPAGPGVGALPGLGAREPRGAVPRQANRRRAEGRGRRRPRRTCRGAGRPRPSPPTRSSWCRPPTPRTCSARATSAWLWAPGSMARPSSCRCGAPSRPATWGCSTSWTRVRPSRSATSAG